MSADAKDPRSPLDLISRLLAALPLPAFVVDEQHSVRYMNRAARQRAPELNEDGSPCYARVFHRDSPCELCVMTEAMADGADEVLCSQEIAGQQVRATGVRFADQDGTAYVAEIVHMGGEGLVSSRSSMDLREDAMLSVIDSSNEVVLLFDAEYRPVIVNRLAQVTLGYTAAEFAERTLVDLGIANSPDELGKLLARAESGAPASARAVILTSQGGKMPVKVSLSLLVGSSTRVVGSCTFAAPRYSSVGLPALQRSVSGPLPKPGQGRASGPIAKPGLPARPAPPSKPKTPAAPVKPASKASSGSAAPKIESGGVRRISESLEALAGDLDSGSAAGRKAEAGKVAGRPKPPLPSTPDKDGEVLEELDLLDIEENGTSASAPPSPPPSPPSPPSKPATKAPSKPATRAPSKPATKAPSKPATKAPSEPATKAPSEPATKAPSKPATKAPSKPATKAPSKPATKAPSKPATKAPSKPATKAPPKPAPQPPKEVTVQVAADPSVVAAASETIYALLGYPSTEVVTWTAQDWFTRVHEPQLAQDLANMWNGLVGQVFESGALPDQIMEYPLIRKDGTVVDCSTTWRAVQGADGKFEGLEVVIRPKPV